MLVYDSRNNCNAIIETSTNTLIFGCQNTTIPNSVTSIGEYAFFNCISLTSIEIPNSVTSIGDYAFSDCSSLTSVTIPNSVTSIGSGAFYNCRSLTSVTISNSVTSIGDYAFNGVNNIIYSGTATGAPWGAKCVNGYVDGYLVYSDATKTILVGCSAAAIGEIVIPNSVTSIADYAFSGCSSLTSVTIGNSVTSIGDYAFRGCSSLTSVTIGNSVTSIGNEAFSGCTGLTSVTIGNSVTSIGEWAFNGCRSLTSVTIPNSVTSIGEYAFGGVNNIIYSGTATGSPWGARCVNGYVDGYLVYSDATKTILVGCSAAATGEIVIPNSVTSIGYDAFWGCSSLTSVTIPNSVTSIGRSAFSGCSGLTSVTIGNSVTSIGSSAFSGCSGLTSVTIGNSVTSIGDYAFSGCSGLTSVTIGNSVTSIGESAFEWCSSLTSVTIGNSVTSIGESAFEWCSSLTSVTIGNSVTSIESSIFKGCNNISSVIWNAKNCSTYNFGTQVESFVFGNDVEIIPNSLCQGMNKLTSVTIPNSVTSIGERTFDGCNNLETVSLGSSLESIGTKAFNGCERIIDIYCYAERVPTVQSSTFDGVSRKAYLWVPASRLRNYETHEIWGEFLVQPMAAEDVNTNTVAVVPDYNTAIVIWTVVENADSYSITITDKDGKTVCTLVFDSNGLLQSIAFGAPSRNNAPEQTQSTGFRFEVSGLEEGTAYDYTIVAKDVASQTLQTFNGSFKTLGVADAIADINVNAASHKILRNGEVLILRDGKTYTIQGVEVK